MLESLLFERCASMCVIKRERERVRALSPSFIRLCTFEWLGQTMNIVMTDNLNPIRPNQTEFTGSSNPITEIDLLANK